MGMRIDDHYQICPKCGYSEERGRRWDRWVQVYRFFWRNIDCPECGTELIRECPSCEAPITDAEDKACPKCSADYPWASPA